MSPLENPLILTQLVRGVSVNSMREKLLRIVDLDLKKAIKICKASEIVKKQAQELHIAPEGTLVNTGKKCTNSQVPSSSMLSGSILLSRMTLQVVHRMSTHVEGVDSCRRRGLM